MRRLVFDYHVHTTFSVDCNTPIDASCVAAIADGVTEIAFTDHVDHQPADPGFGFYRPVDYLAEIERVREKYGDRLTILEAPRSTTTTIPALWLSSSWPMGDKYDFVIGSVHYGEKRRDHLPRILCRQDRSTT